MSEEKDVLTEMHGNVLLVSLNRPDRLNALTSSMTDLLMAAFSEADSSDDIAAVVLTGRGRGFCAGADTSGLQSIGADEVRARATAYPRDTPKRLSKPLIAAINGPVAGMGLSMALMADVRFASTTASMTTAFARYGLVAEMGASFLLRELVGPANALDLLLSSRKIDAETGYRMGLYQFLCEPDALLDSALSYAEQVALNSSFSIAQMKEQVLADASRSWQEAYDDSVARMYRSLESSEFRDKVAGSATTRSATKGSAHA